MMRRKKWLKEKTIFLSVLVILFFSFISLDLKAGYLDVGSDPDKIKVVTSKQLSIPQGFEFKKWSHDGDYFIASNHIEKHLFPYERLKLSEFKTYIYNKNGELLKKMHAKFVLWALDSKKVVIMDANHKLWLQVILSNQKQEIMISKHVDLNLHCFNPKNGDLIYNDGSKLMSYNFSSQKSMLIYDTASYSMARPKYIFVTNDNHLFFTQYSRNSGFKSPLFQIDLYSKTKKKFVDGEVVPVYYFNISRKKVVLLYSIVYKNIVIDEEGNVLFKFDSFHELTGASPEEKYEEYFYTTNSSMAPNGKLYAVTSGKYTETTEILTADIYIFNFSGKRRNLTNTLDKEEVVMGWSPQGDKLVYYEDTERQFYMMHISVQ